MSHPDFDELDVLMGDAQPRRRPPREDTEAIDVTNSRPTRHRDQVNEGVPEGGNSRTAFARHILGGMALLVVGLGVWLAIYLWRELGPREVSAPQDLVAETLGVRMEPPTAVDPAPAPSVSAPVPPETQPAAANPGDAGGNDAGGNAVSEVDLTVIDAPGDQLLPTAPSPAPPVEVVADAAEVTALKDEKKRLAADLERAKADLAREKAKTAGVQRELEAARRRQPDVLVRDSRTTVTLTEVLSDGAVLRDRSGNEVIVPRGTSFEVVGDRVALGVPR